MKIFTCALVICILAATAVKAQTGKADSSTLFHGTGSYNTWSIGFGLGVTSPRLFTSSQMDYSNAKAGLAGTFTLKKQFYPSFGLQFEGQYGQVNYKNSPNNDNLSGDATTYFSATVNGVVNLGAIDFLNRKKAVSFYLKGGLGTSFYQPQLKLADGSTTDFKNPGVSGVSHTINSLIVPVGAGLKIKAGDRTSINIGYSETFVDADNFDGLNKGYPSNDHYAYAYAGLEFTLGKKSKLTLEESNLVALMYDSLSNSEYRKELIALKQRVANVENGVNDLKKDSDGDGISDQFDKCPNTLAGSVVDGSGCGIVFPKADTVKSLPTGSADSYSFITFDFNSDVLRESPNPLLDAMAKLLVYKHDIRKRIIGYRLPEEGKNNTEQADLSFRRAESIKAYLIKKKVYPKQLFTIGAEAQQPVADNSTEKGGQLNRRAEFQDVKFAAYKTIAFSATSSHISDSSLVIQMAESLKQHPNWKAIIYGHSSSSYDKIASKDDKHRASLAEARAQAVKKILLKHGVKADRIIQASGTDNHVALEKSNDLVVEIFAVTY